MRASNVNRSTCTAKNQTRLATQSSEKGATSKDKAYASDPNNTLRLNDDRRLLAAPPQGANNVQGHPGSRRKPRPAVSCAHQRQDDESPGVRPCMGTLKTSGRREHARGVAATHHSQVTEDVGETAPSCTSTPGKPHAQLRE
jgi:hypothetical protein